MSLSISMPMSMSLSMSISMSMLKFIMNVYFIKIKYKKDLIYFFYHLAYSLFMPTEAFCLVIACIIA
jgi:hypothetical protein